MGLGKQRRRFHIRQVKGLEPDGAPRDEVAAWSLGEVRFPSAIDAPCRLAFPTPLRLMRRDQLIREPTLTDLVVAACRRIGEFLPARTKAGWSEVRERAIALSRDVPADPWSGDRLDLQRYSGSQRRELKINGVSGCLELPNGPGPLWPLLAAAQWLHLGKSTVVGLGLMCVEIAAS
jgi:hypothetical protein